MTGPAQTAGDMAIALERGETEARTLVESALERIGRTNDDWHVFTCLTAESALAAARQSDERRRAGRSLSRLDGIPVAVKDNIDVAGAPTTDGTACYRNRIAEADALAVRKLKDAGAIIVGKLNMHEGALGATTDNPFWGRCENPRFPGHTPGGSSGGSGAAVAGGLVPITLGTDTMGSVRIPAAYCGTWGLKPTYGLISSTGLSQLSWSLDTIGPLANSADDLAIAISTLAAADPANPDDMPAPADWHGRASRTASPDCVIGRPVAIDQVDCERDVLETYESFLHRAGVAGAAIQPVTVSGWAPGRTRRAGLLVSEAEVGSRIGEDLDGCSDGFSGSFRSMVNYGREVRGESLAAAYRHLKNVGFALRAAFRSVDFLALPTAPQRPFRHGETSPANQADFTAIANIAGCPAVCFPIPGDNGQPPFSIQLVGPPYSEFDLIAAAKRLQAC